MSIKWIWRKHSRFKKVFSLVVALINRSMEYNIKRPMMAVGMRNSEIIAESDMKQWAAEVGHGVPE